MSEYSDIAIRQAFDIAKIYDAEVFILHVIKDSVKQCAVDYCISEELLHELEGQMFASARAGILSQLAKFASMGVSRVTTDVRTGSPHDEILKEAEERGVDLIVISSFGKTGLARYLLGGVVRHVLAGSTCSVLLVK